MFGNAYNKKRVFITGHTGFKGSWLSTWLLNLGAEVCGYSLDIPSEPSNFEVLGLESKMRHIKGDVKDLAFLKKTLEDFKPHIIFHMAAQALVRPSYDNPENTFLTNAIGTMNLLEAARDLRDLEALICITSDKCYRNDEWVWGYRETDHLGGKDPYSASKACAEIIAQSYFQSFYNGGVATATVRAGNVIGGGDWAVDRIVPDCARSLASKEAVYIRSPRATRPWQHVLEPLSGYLWLGAKMLAGERKGLDKESFNFGPAAEVKASVEEVVRSLKMYWPGFLYEVNQAEDEGKESTLLKLCCDKALAYLDWHAVLSFEETMEYTATWYLNYYEADKDNFVFTKEQISKYCQRAKERGLSWAK